MTLIGCASVAAAVVLIALYLKPQQKEIASLLAIAGALLLFAVSLTHASGAIVFIRKTVSGSAYTAEVETMFKALGIAAVAQITADVCRTSGEAVSASQVELIGKMEIVILALPLAARLLALAQTLLS